MADQRVFGRLTTVMLTRTAPTVYNYFPRSVRWLGLVQVIWGAILVAFSVISSVVAQNASGLGSCVLPVLTILAGAFGMAAASQKTSCKIITTLVLSVLIAIINFFSAIVLIILMPILIDEINRQTNTYPYSYSTSAGTSRARNLIYGVCITLVILNIIQACTSVAMAVISCKFTCFCCKTCCCCDYDTTTTEKGILCEGQSHEPLQDVVYNATPTTYVVNSQQQTMYQPITTAAAGTMVGNNTWLQRDKYTRLDDEMLSA